MALLIPNAHAMVISTSHEMYLVYFLGGNILVQAMITAVTAAKKNMSSRIFGKASFTPGRVPTVAPVIMSIRRVRANHLLRFTL